MEKNKIKMNKNFILVKRDDSLKKVGGLLTPDESGNSVKGVIIRSSDSCLFPVGSLAYCAKGTKIKVSGEELFVINVEDVFFIVESDHIEL